MPSTLLASGIESSQNSLTSLLTSSNRVLNVTNIVCLGNPTIDAYVPNSQHSEYSDSHMLWSQYGNANGSTGYAIGFDSNKLLDSLRNGIGPWDSVHAGRVIYDITNQESYISAKVGITLSFWRQLSEEDRGKVFNDTCNLLAVHLFLKALFYKHPSFKQEEEFRFVVIRYASISPTDVCFREMNGVFIPYIKMPLVKDKHDVISCIKEIRLSPRTSDDYAYKGLRYFLDQHGMQTALL